MEILMEITLVVMLIIACTVLVLTIGIKYELKEIREELELYEALNNERYKDLDRRVEVVEERMESYEIHP